MLEIIGNYRYVVLLFIAIPEGPMISMLAGFFVSTGYLSLVPSLLILILGNVIPDMGYYYLGRFGTKIDFVQKNMNKIIDIEKIFPRHFKKIIFLGKLSMFFSSLVIISAGVAKIPMKKVITFTVFMDLLIITILISLGSFLGHAYNLYFKYVNYFGLVVTFIFVVFIIFLRQISKNVDKEIISLEKEYKNYI